MKNTTARLDPNMATRDADGGLDWYDAGSLGVEGQGWRAESAPFARLPGRAQATVRPEVWELSRHAAGLCVRFATAATRVCADWALGSPALAMDHMPATGVSGLDLYVRAARGRWRWLGVGRATEPVNRKELTGGLDAGRHEFLLYLPLYNAVEHLRIGVPAGCAIARPRRPPARPVVCYGTSIVQGGCASRPGMAYPAIIGRRLDVPVVNLGFSGNGRMEPEVAGLLAEIDAAVYVLDPLPNNSAADVRERMGPLVRTLRAARPGTPIIVVENVTYTYAHLRAGIRSCVREVNAALRRVLRELRRDGVRGLTCVPGAGLLGADGEATVDGVHATDVGFLRMAAALTPVVRAALRKEARGSR